MATFKPFQILTKGIIPFLSIAVMLGATLPVNAVWKAKVRVTTQGAPWTNETSVPIVNAAASGAYVSVDTTTKYQTIDGFGGCFNESAGKCLIT